MPWTKEELTKLRSELPRGASSILAEKFNMKSGSVRNVLSGLANNDRIVLAALELAKEYQESLINGKSYIAAI